MIVLRVKTACYPLPSAISSRDKFLSKFASHRLLCFYVAELFMVKHFTIINSARAFGWGCWLLWFCLFPLPRDCKSFYVKGVRTGWMRVMWGLKGDQTSKRAFHTRIIFHLMQMIHSPLRLMKVFRDFAFYRPDTDIDSAQSHSSGNSFNFFPLFFGASTRDISLNRPNSRGGKKKLKFHYKLI